MPSKWCDRCEKIVSSSSVPNFCTWCGNNLVACKVLPVFSTLEEKEQIIKQIKSKVIPTKIDKSGQVKLF